MNSLEAAFPKESDIRFQFRIIEQLSENFRMQTTSVERLTNTVSDMQKTQVGMLERLARIEANTINRDVAGLQDVVNEIMTRLDSLEQERDRREGAASVGDRLMRYWPIVSILGLLLYILLSATGIVRWPTPVVAVQSKGDH